MTTCTKNQSLPAPAPATDVVRRLAQGEEGMSTIEYAVGSLAAAALAAVLIAVVKSGPVRQGLQDIILNALNSVS